MLLIQPLTWANNTESEQLDELGRSLANYQVCSRVAMTVNDELMFRYYQTMFNDTRFSLLKKSRTKVGQVYTTWNKSEQILLKITEENLLKFCLSRFDDLSRKMQKK